jgi:hypothetical protein
MSYSEENGLVILSMSREDYERVLLLLGQATVESVRRHGRSLFNLNDILALLNRLNQGNPNYTPYQEELFDILDFRQ